MRKGFDAEKFTDILDGELDVNCDHLFVSGAKLFEEVPPIHSGHR